MKQQISKPEAVSLISFVGPVGSGKDFEAQKYLEKGYVQIGMADLVREIVWKQIGWFPKNLAQYEAFKTTIFIGARTESYLGHFTGRDLLNGLTNEIIKVNPDFWFEEWSKKVKLALAEGKNVVLTDMRYESSVKYLLDIASAEVNCKIIFCNYKSEKYSLQEGLTEKMIGGILNELGDIPHFTDITSYFEERFSKE